MTHILKNTSYDCLLRELWNDQAFHGDKGLGAGDVSGRSQYLARRDQLDRMVREGFACTRYSGPRGGLRYHAR